MIYQEQQLFHFCTRLEDTTKDITGSCGFVLCLHVYICGALRETEFSARASHVQPVSSPPVVLWIPVFSLSVF